jgi:hypothetical protein
MIWLHNYIDKNHKDILFYSKDALPMPKPFMNRDIRPNPKSENNSPKYTRKVPSFNQVKGELRRYFYHIALSYRNPFLS